MRTSTSKTSPSNPSRPPKIAVIGTHSTGKTTLCLELAKSLGVPYVEEATRTVCKTRGWKDIKQITQNGSDALAEFEWDVYQLMRRNEQEQSEGHPFVICDRSTLDIIPYGEAAAALWPNRKVMNLWVAACLNWVPTYDLFFYLPIEFDVVHDGFRDTDPQTREWIDKSIQARLNGAGLPVHTIAGPIEHRVQMCLDIITRTYGALPKS